MSPPFYDDLPPPYVLGDITPLYTKLPAGPESAPEDSHSSYHHVAYSSSKPDKKPSSPPHEEIIACVSRNAVAGDEALINGNVPDRTPPSRTVLMTHTETYTNRAGEHSHVVAWVWLEDGRVYYGKHAASGLYDGAGPSPATPSVACIDGLVIPRMKEGYHRASPESLSVAFSRLSGRDTGPDLCARNPSFSASSVELDQHEIEMYERLSGHPHPNVTEYYGVSTYNDEYITGICIGPSKLTLRDTLLSSPFVRLGHLERGLYAGIAHLHSQGIQHNNLSLSSVRTNGNGDAVISDLRFSTLMNPENGDAPSVGGGLQGWLRRRHDPDYIAARHLMREARTLRLYAVVRFAYWKVWGGCHSFLGGINAAVTDLCRIGRAVRNPLLFILDDSV